MACLAWIHRIISIIGGLVREKSCRLCLLSGVMNFLVWPEELGWDRWYMPHDLISLWTINVAYKNIQNATTCHQFETSMVSNRFYQETFVETLKPFRVSRKEASRARDFARSFFTEEQILHYIYRVSWWRLMEIKHGWWGQMIQFLFFLNPIHLVCVVFFFVGLHRLHLAKLSRDT